MARRDRAVEDEAPDPTLVDRGVGHHRRPGLATERGVERAQARADSGVAEIHPDRVVPEIGPDPGRDRVEPGERAEPVHLALRVDEEGVVVRDDAALGRDEVEHAGVVPLPEREAERVGVLVPALQRERDLERVAHADDEPEVGLEVEPVGRGEAGARVLEPPALVLAQRGERGGGRVREVGDPGIVDRLGRELRRVVPRSARGLEQLVVARDDRLVLPEPLGIVLGGVDQLLGAAPDQVQAGVVERARDHRRPRPVHAGDGNRVLPPDPPHERTLPQSVWCLITAGSRSR